MPGQKQQKAKNKKMKKEARKRKQKLCGVQNKKKKKKKRKEFSSSQSRSRSRLRQDKSSRQKKSSRSYSSSPQSHKEYLQSKIQKSRQLMSRSSSNFVPKKIKINSNMLANIISDQKKMNCKLDLEETNRAAYKFKQIFKEEIKPVTMSSFLSNQQLIKIVEAKQTSGTLVCTLCSTFCTTKEELIEHLESHN